MNSNVEKSCITNDRLDVWNDFDFIDESIKSKLKRQKSNMLRTVSASGYGSVNRIVCKSQEVGYKESVFSFFICF